jgi:hypothetical protein
MYFFLSFLHEIFCRIINHNYSILEKNCEKVHFFRKIFLKFSNKIVNICMKNCIDLFLIKNINIRKFNLCIFLP